MDGWLDMLRSTYNWSLADRIAQYNQQFIQGDYCDIRTKAEACPLTCFVSKNGASGEPWKDAIKPKVVVDYENYGHAYLKFVVATEDDIQDALKATQEYRDAGFQGPVYLMPVGGVESVYALNNRAVALAAMKHGLRYSDRLQVPLFKNEWGT
jgi:hypothetical protein